MKTVEGDYHCAKFLVSKRFLQIFLTDIKEFKVCKLS